MRRIMKLCAPAAFLGLMAAALVFAGLLVERYERRFDVTATADHRLSERTRLVLSELRGDWRLVLAVDASTLAGDRFRRLRDVLETFAAAESLDGAAIEPVVLDLSDPRGATGYRELIEDLAESERGRIEAQRERVEAVVEELERIARAAPRISSELGAIATAIDERVPSAEANRTFFLQQAAAVRGIGEDTGPVVEAVRQRLDPEQAPGVGSIQISRPDLASAALSQPTDAVLAQIGTLARELARFGGSAAVPTELRERTLVLAGEVGQFRDRFAQLADAIARMPRPDVLRIADALASGEAMIVAGPAGVTAIDLAALLPDGAALEALGLRAADARQRAEELIATAIGSLVLAEPPIVVLVHGETQRFLGRAPVFERGRERLGLRGIDVVEWPATVERERPSLTDFDPAGTRPVVYLTLAPDGTAAAGAGSAGAERLRTWADALIDVVESGDPLLLTLNPSVLPSFGDADPQNEVLSAFGLRAGTDRPMLGERREAGDRVVLTDLETIAADSNHPLGRAVSGQRLLLPWPVGIEGEGAAVVRTTPADGLWFEDEWLGLWRTPRNQRALLESPPEFDQGSDDLVTDSTLVVAAQRELDGELARLVAVGSNAWHIDQVVGQAALIDGRAVPFYPGNLELLEAAVYWLAGQETLIAPSARAGTSPTIRIVDAQHLSLIRWSLALGPAMLVLLVGLAWRWARG
ncbi:MAG: hypothetical protein AAGB51_14740 [Planctomycetota bacterium]